jgi:hypothetical protein
MANLPNLNPPDQVTPFPFSLAVKSFKEQERMARKKTAAQHALNGTNRPDRQRRTVANPDGIGEPPEHLGDLAELWRELEAGLPEGVGAPSDRPAFELLVRLNARMRAGAFTASEAAQLRLLMDSFGMSPAGRQRLDIKPPPEPGPYDEFKSPYL